MNKEQNKLARKICLIFSPIFLIAGIVQESFLYGFVIPSLLVSIFFYLRKSSVIDDLVRPIESKQFEEISSIKKSINARAEDSILGPALVTLRRLAYDEKTGIANYEEDEKDRLIYDCLLDIEQTLFEKDKIKSVRLKIIDLMFDCSEMNVLIMKPPTMSKMLSGEIEVKIVEFFAVSEALQKTFPNIEPNSAEFDVLKNEIIQRYLRLHFYMSAYNAVRFCLNDFNDDLKKDWFRTCYVSLCIWHEDTFRTQLGMPSLVANPLKVIAYSGWLSVVNENPNDLRESFEQKWQNCFNEPSPFYEVEV